MFRSRSRDVVFPQAEHARLAGAIARAWGNDRFPRPPFPFDSFVAGVALHDRGYGELDDDPIGGGMPPARWVEIQLAGAEPRGDDPVVDLVAAMHILRLMTPPESDEERAARERVGSIVPRLRDAARVTEADAEEADRITQVCDTVAFDFPWEEPASGVVNGIAYELDGEGTIALDPWPLAVPRLPGFVFAYRAGRYPSQLEPVLVPFDVQPVSR
jgi:hypothetical protein